MALSTETNAWLEGLKKEGGIGDEALASLKQSLEGKADEYVKGSVLRQQDYSRNMGEVSKAKADLQKTVDELAAKDAAVTKYQQELGTWKAGADKNYQKALADQETAMKTAAAAKARLDRLGVAYNIPAEELALDGVTTPPANKDNNVPSNFDVSKFVTREDVSKNIREAGLLDAMIYDLGEEHRALFGQRLPNAQQLVQEALASGKTLSDYWAEKYKVVDARKAQEEVAIQKRIDDAVAASRTKILSEAGLPAASTGMRTDLVGSPVLKEGGIPAPPKDNEGAGVSAAIAAFQAGTHRIGK